MEEFEQIRAVYESYDELIQTIGAELIENRFNKLYKDMECFLEGIDKNGKAFKINSRVLLIAILDFFADIDRLKLFHHIDKINEFKTKSYEVAWLLRRKPIQTLIEESDEGMEPSTIEDFDYINEQFVFNYLMAFLLDCRDIKDNKEIEKLNGFFDSVFYYLKFRNCEPRVLELMLISFKAGEIVQKLAE